MSDLHLPTARAFAEQLAAQAADIIRALWGQTDFTRKADRSMVTEADRRVQQHLAAAIADRYPEHGFIGEESLPPAEHRPEPSRSEYCWVVDPLDGTRNFVHQLPITATSLALMKGPNVVVAVVLEHASRWCCSAMLGDGVWCNGRRVGIARRPLSRDTLIAIPTGRDEPILPVIKTWMDRYILRNVGSTALHLAYVAAGAADAALCRECKIWDVAAGSLLIAEAGGRCVHLNGGPLIQSPPWDYLGQDLPFFASSPEVFDPLFRDVAG